MRGGFEKALRQRSIGHDLQSKSEDEDTEKTSLPTRVEAEER